MQPRKHIDLLILLVEQLLQLADLSFQLSYALLERLGVASGKCATAELVAGLAFESDVGALRAAWSYTVAADLLASASTSYGQSSVSFGTMSHDLIGTAGNVEHTCRKPVRSSTVRLSPP